MNISRRALSATLLLGATGVAPFPATADAYPDKPITIVYPYAGGSASDVLARQVAAILSSALGQPVVVESRPGAGGSVGLEHVARSAPDGYTLAFTASGTMSVNPHLYHLKYRPVDDLASITTLVDIPFIVVTRAGFPATTLAGFIAHARANPGTVSFANAGMGTQAHLTQVMFMRAAGIEANVVSYKGGTPAMADLMGGHIDAMIDNVAAQVENVRARKVRALFVTTRTRSASLPNVPTADEAGLPGFVASGWFGLAAPRGTPQAVVDQLNSVIAKAFSQAETRRKLVAAGWFPVASSPADADARARADLVRFGAIAREINLKPN
ncbi:MAG TPA: tripartite tricarboxylate transporter substrate binding protein [Arthrobacter sp.]|nr:tripartite tricarboxylate transporter substrate binding protein [Arthrobacter sp.]